MNDSRPLRDIRAAPVRKSVRVKAGVERAFDVFTSGLDHWWPRSHQIGEAPLQEIVLEPFAGGRWYERGDDGSECDWGKVLEWEPPSRVVLAWQIDSKFAYDALLMTTVEICFVAESAYVTRVELEHRDLDRLGDEGEALREIVDSPRGWGLIVAEYAKGVAEEMDHVV